MEVKIKDLHPTQLYLSEKKLQDIQMICQSAEIINMDPISVLAFGDCLLITDGHHRAYQALLTGQNTISAEWDKDGGDETVSSLCASLRGKKDILYSGFKKSYLSSR